MPLDSRGNLPNVELGAIQLLRDSLLRARHVGTDQGPGKQRLPNVVLFHDGGLPLEDLTRIDRARITCFSRGRDREQAWRMARDVRNVFVPTTKIVGGLYRTVRYFDEDIEEFVDILFGHAREDASPRFLPDERGVPMVRESFMVVYS